MPQCLATKSRAFCCLNSFLFVFTIEGTQYYGTPLAKLQNFVSCSPDPTTNFETPKNSLISESLPLTTKRRQITAYCVSCFRFQRELTQFRGVSVYILLQYMKYFEWQPLSLFRFAIPFSSFSVTAKLGLLTRQI